MPSRALLAAALLAALAALASADLLCLTNLERQKAGLAPLHLSPELQAAAQVHSDDMAAGGFMSHTGSDGSSPWDRFARFGFTDLRTGGENVAAGQTTEEQVMASWMGSPGHRANILSADFTFFGGARAGNYWNFRGDVQRPRPGRPLRFFPSAAPSSSPCPGACSLPLPSPRALADADLRLALQAVGMPLAVLSYVRM
ncbi:CAP domain-containing protein [Hyaloraphidium curvatum]|nr:CAP domain-containing protein [Hyaloraphidium curvatum]